MPISATCPQCGANLPVPDEYAGQTVRCGGCQGAVNVPLKADPPPTGRPIALPRARPVAAPVAKARRAEPEPPPVAKARKDRPDEDEEPEEDDTPKRRAGGKRRPIAKRRRVSVLTPAAVRWLTAVVITGVLGLAVLAYAAWGVPRKADGSAARPTDVNRDGGRHGD